MSSVKRTFIQSWPEAAQGAERRWFWGGVRRRRLGSASTNRRSHRRARCAGAARAVGTAAAPCGELAPLVALDAPRLHSDLGALGRRSASGEVSRQNGHHRRSQRQREAPQAACKTQNAAAARSHGQTSHLQAEIPGAPCTSGRRRRGASPQRARRPAGGTRQRRTRRPGGGPRAGGSCLGRGGGLHGRVRVRAGRGGAGVVPRGAATYPVWAPPREVPKQHGGGRARGAARRSCGGRRGRRRRRASRSARRTPTGPPPAE